MGRDGIVIILSGDRAFVPGLVTAVADIRSLINPSALFPFKITAENITAAAGVARDVTEEDLLTGIDFPTPEAMDAKVVRVIRTAPVLGVWYPVFKDLIGNVGRVFAEIAYISLKDIPSPRECSM